MPGIDGLLQPAEDGARRVGGVIPAQTGIRGRQAGGFYLLARDTMDSGLRRDDGQLWYSPAA